MRNPLAQRLSPPEMVGNGQAQQISLDYKAYRLTAEAETLGPCGPWRAVITVADAHSNRCKISARVGEYAAEEAALKKAFEQGMVFVDQLDELTAPEMLPT